MSGIECIPPRRISRVQLRNFATFRKSVGMSPLWRLLTDEDGDCLAPNGCIYAAVGRVVYVLSPEGEWSVNRGPLPKGFEALP